MTIYNDIALLDSKFQVIARSLGQQLIDAYETGITKTRFELYETYRDIFRHRDLIAKGIAEAGSAHRNAYHLGLAVSIVPWINADEAIALSEASGDRVWPGWNWSKTHDWEFLHKIVITNKLLVPLKNCPWHVIHPDYPYR